MDDIRLIDANALLKEFEKQQEQQTNEYCDCFLNDAQELSTEWCDGVECERLCMQHTILRPGFKWRGVKEEKK